MPMPLSPGAPLSSCAAPRFSAIGSRAYAPVLDRYSSQLFERLQNWLRRASWATSRLLHRPFALSPSQQTEIRTSRKAYSQKELLPCARWPDGCLSTGAEGVMHPAPRPPLRDFGSLRITIRSVFFQLKTRLAISVDPPIWPSQSQGLSSRWPLIARLLTASLHPFIATPVAWVACHPAWLAVASPAAAWSVAGVTAAAT